MPSTSKQNLLAGNRATLTIQKFGELVYYIQDFSLPGVSLPPAKMATPFVDIPFAGEKLDFGMLKVTFLVNEDLSNWNNLFQWMIGLGFPVRHKQYQEKKIAYSDASMIIHSNHQNPIAKADFFELYPCDLGPVSFSSQDSETSYKKADVTFALMHYDLSPM